MVDSLSTSDLVTDLKKRIVTLEAEMYDLYKASSECVVMDQMYRADILWNQARIIGDAAYDCRELYEDMTGANIHD